MNISASCITVRNPGDLSQTAKSHPSQPGPIQRRFSVCASPDLSPQTTYYYWVTSAGSDGKSNGVKSAVKQFTTPAPGPANRRLSSTEITATIIKCLNFMT